MTGLRADITRSDLAVMASPTYKASYTGLLKGFLDGYDTDGLAGVPIIPLHTGGDRTHALSPTMTLAPLLLELGALVIGKGVYFPLSETNPAEAVGLDVVQRYRDNLARVLPLARAIPNKIH